MKLLNVAVIGCGAISGIHCESIINSKYSNLYCVADIDEEKAKTISKKYNCKYNTDYKNVLLDESVDIVHICTPHHIHKEIAVKAMEHKKHVFCEKPISIMVEDAKHMIQSSKHTKMKLGVCFQNRYNNTTIKMKEIIDSDILGKVKGVRSIITWNREESYYKNSTWKGRYATEGGGALINQSIHTLDLIQYLCGNVDRLKANIDNRTLKDIIEVEDTADATINLSNGARWIFYATNGYTMDEPLDIHIHFEQGALRLVDGELIVSKDGKKQVIASDNAEETEYAAYWGTSHSRAVNRFYESIINKNDDYISGEEAIKSLKLIEAIVKSSNKNTQIVL